MSTPHNPAVEPAKVKEPFPPRWVLFVSILAILAAVVVGLFQSASEREQKLDIALQVQQACDAKVPVTLQGRDLCQTAEQVVKDASPADLPSGWTVIHPDGLREECTRSGPTANTYHCTIPK
jgi:hypothetical protein